ncbi:hypothetical protein K461DRAFT_296958 [Myriangium duriaei CBS 260.36]|uniref:Integral membrane protein n=1 Tax=Myriangium duriaei CBS 260.36 TaxID=1168546 RepID=A0A9P4IZ47_9PEZI|nr:hypothetical protein K461DRAFT_296958 [Myriangium duriaei CBS 260.36]
MSNAMIFAVPGFVASQQMLHYGGGSITILTLAPLATSKLRIVALLASVQGLDAELKIRFLWSVGILQAVISLVFMFITIFECHSVQRLWDFTSPGTCNLSQMTVNFSVFQACIIPGILSVCRAVVIYRVVHDPDASCTYTKLTLWYSCEVWLIVILATIPLLRPLVRRFFKGKVAEGVEYTTPYSMEDSSAQQIENKYFKSADPGNLDVHISTTMVFKGVSGVPSYRDCVSGIRPRYSTVIPCNRDVTYIRQRFPSS